MQTNDVSKALLAQVKEAIAHGTPLAIEGGGSKRFYGYPQAGGMQGLDVTAHTGVIDYEPAELVLHVRAGTRLSEINALLHENKQHLPFEPPDFDGKSTIGGVIASGLSGPRRPWAGPVRDYVLGVTLVTGQGEVLEFGGQVMKNVAGYDVSRLVTGAMGTLGVILDVSLKVLPAPEVELSRAIAISGQQFQARLQAMQRTMPVSAAAFEGGQLRVRLSGSEVAVAAAAQEIGGENAGNEYWQRLNTLACFPATQNLWRASVAPASKLFLDDAAVIDWGGGLRWLSDPAYDPRTVLNGEDGHVTLVKYGPESLAAGVELFQPLAGPLLGIHRRLKQQFDPASVFNPGRMYRDM